MKIDSILDISLTNIDLISTDSYASYRIKLTANC